MALIRTFQKCEVFLTKFKEEICCNPYTDVTPYTQMLAAEFKKWHKAYEKRIISTFFLNLYEQDAQSLQQDLCKLEPREVLGKIKALDTAKAKFPQRATLLGCLYNTLTYYIGPNFSWLFEDCERLCEIEHIKYELVREKYELEQRKHDIELILSEFAEEICRNPDADFSLFTDELANWYDMLAETCLKRVIKTLLLNLYAQDANSFKAAVTKIKMKLFDQTIITPEQRQELLACLYGALSSYIGEDFSWLIATCDKVKAF